LAKSKQKVATINNLQLDYQLAELPSSQHRAGLAGLVLVVQWLQNDPTFQKKVQAGALCRLTRLDDNGATLEINQAGLEALFDEIYAANLEERDYDKPKTKGKGEKKETVPWKGYPEPKKGVDPKTGKPKKLYPYDDVIPQGSFLAHSTYDASSDGKNGYWIKLWRDMVWSILRGVPATRKPFEDRAEGNHTKDAADSWAQLTQSKESTVNLPSTYFLGAQANNAENVPFKDRARFQFLLHFWLFAAQIYVPQVTRLEKDKDAEGKSEWVEKRNFVGYAIAIPDIARLKWFCEELPRLLRDRSSELSGYRPRDCIVDLAVESALHMMKRLRDRLQQTTGDQATAPTLFGIDVIHSEKQGDKVRLLSATRIDPDATMIDEYAQIRDGFWSPLFRRQCLLNLVNHSPWHTGFDALLCTLPYKQTIEDRYFRGDVRKKIEQEKQNMSETATDVAIEPMVFQLVKNYVSRKLKAKYGLEWKLEWKALKPEELNECSDYLDYSEKKAKIAKTAFLDIRSRTEQMDFINYFVSSLCSVPQHMKSDDFVTLTQALYQDTDKIRTLTLLALSANG